MFVKHISLSVVLMGLFFMCVLKSTGLAAQVPETLESEIQFLVVEVILNDQAMGTSIIVSDTEGNLYVPEKSLLNWELQKPYPEPVEFKGKIFYPTADLAGYSSSLDTRTYVLTIDLKADAFADQIIDLNDHIESMQSHSDTGFKLDYDLSILQVSEGGNQSGLLIRPVYFSPQGRVHTEFSWESDPIAIDQASVVFYDTYYQKDNPHKQTSLRIGDGITTSSSWGRAARFGGVQYGRNFSLQPRMITYPLPILSGEAVVPSNVDIFVNQAQVEHNTVTPGLFEVRNIPSVNGAGELQLIVTDNLGRQTVQTTNFYSSPSLLRQGLDSYSVSLGSLRENFGLKNFDYASYAGVGEYRRGINNSLTLGSRLETSKQTTNLGIDGTFTLANAGLVNLAYAHSSNDVGGGGLLRFNYEYSSPLFRVGAAYQNSDENFQYLGVDAGIELPLSQVSLSAGTRFKNIGSLGLAYVSQDYSLNENLSITSMTFQRSVKDWFSLSMFTSLINNRDNSSETSIGISLNRPLGKERSVDVQLDHNELSNSINTQYRKYTPYGEGTGYRLGSRYNDLNGYELEADWIKKARPYRFGLESRYANSILGVRSNLSGTISHLDGYTEFSREIQDAFAVVKVDEIENVRVYHENQVIGKTNAQGILVIPTLRAFDINKVRVEIKDLPLTTRLGEFKKNVSPYRSSGVLVEFDIDVPRTYKFIVVDNNGVVLDVGSRIYTHNTYGFQDLSIVGYEGQVYLTVGIATKSLSIDTEFGTCTIELENLEEYKPQLSPTPQTTSCFYD